MIYPEVARVITVASDAEGLFDVACDSCVGLSKIGGLPYCWRVSTAHNACQSSARLR